MKKLILASVTILMMTSFAQAEMKNDAGPQRDQIIISLQKEKWVTTTTANVGVNFDIVQQKETAAELKKSIPDSLKTLAPVDSWHITSSRENKDRTGLNRWHVTAEARIPEDSVSGLNRRAEQVSRPGFNIRIGHVDFSPSLGDMEKVRSDLRDLIYKEAAAEARRLTESIPGRSYRVFYVDFGQNGGFPRPRPMRAMGLQTKEMAMSADTQNGGGNTVAELAVSRRQILSAAVIFTSDVSSEN